MTGTLHRYDRAMGDAAATARNSVAIKILGPASDIADQWQLFTICAVTASVGALRRDRRLAATGVHMALSMLAATALKDFIKGCFDRTRPLVVAQGGRYIFQRGNHDVTELNSFPSGHSAGAVAVARAVAYRYPPAAGTALATAATIAVLQLPRAKHYPIDLVAGTVVGLIAEAAVRYAMKSARSGLRR